MGRSLKKATNYTSYLTKYVARGDLDALMAGKGYTADQYTVTV